MQEIVAAPNIEEKEVMSPKGKDPRRQKHLMELYLLEGHIPLEEKGAKKIRRETIFHTIIVGELFNEDILNLY